mgnify:CR=1 FL=1|tara:strand:+ start:954 stop:2132 length:1179 start_codon:yes stop_codon:yes gene_type:complete
MKKILFCSKYGLDLKNSTGGQHLRIKTSIESLSKICRLKIVSRNVRYEKCEKLRFLHNKSFLFAPSVKKIITKNFISFFVWRFKEFIYLKKDAQFLVNLYKKEKFNCIWISYSSQSYNLIKEIKKIDSSIKIIADTDSVFHKFLERKLKYVNFLKKIPLFFNYKYYENIEKKMLINSEITTAVSEYDKKIFKKMYSKSNIMIFRNAVQDTNIKKKKHTGFNIIISGTFGDKNSPMNISTRWFIEEVFPLIKNRIKNLKVFIVGMNSTKEFRNQKKLFVKGWVFDITKFFAVADIAAVPLKYESGTRFKILEAGIYNLPVVSTTLGAEGLKYKINKSILIADHPKKFAEKIIFLYENKQIRKKIAISNKNLVISEYSVKNLSRDGKKILKMII